MMMKYSYFFQVTISIKKETHVSEFVPLNAPKTRLSAVRRKLLQVANKMISAFTRDLIIISSSVMAFAQLNVRMTKTFAQMILFQTDATNPKTASPNKKITTETSVPTSNVLLNAPKHDIYAKEL